VGGWVLGGVWGGVVGGGGVLLGDWVGGGGSLGAVVIGLLFVVFNMGWGCVVSTHNGDDTPQISA